MFTLNCINDCLNNFLYLLELNEKKESSDIYVVDPAF